jgi:hypothetical protein
VIDPIGMEVGGDQRIPRQPLTSRRREPVMK